MANEDRPAIVIEHGARELRTQPAGGGPRKHFAALTSELRQAVAAQWSAAATHVLQLAREENFPAGVVKVALRRKAIAKSHRPSYLFQQAGRGQVIGTTSIGTLLIKVTEDSLRATAGAILHNDTKDGGADITTVESITPYRSEDGLYAPADRRDLYSAGAIVSLFDFKDDLLNRAAEASVGQLVARVARVAEPRRIARSGAKFVARQISSEGIAALSAHPAVRSVWPNLPVSDPIHSLAASPQEITFGPPVDTAPYPVVGVLDSGVSPAALSLHPWVTNGPSFPPATYDTSDYAHGTFVSGLIIGSGWLNSDVSPLPHGPCKVLSARVFSPREPIGMEDLIPRIEESVKLHSEVKVWNLSLGISTACMGPDFSPFACEIDEIASKHGVVFVIAAGNFGDIPLRPWPADQWHKDGRDIIGPPADAVMGLAVGSVAHNHGVQSAVKKLEPAAYSRRGPAPGLIPKPELSHFGGNCSILGQPDGHGICSVGADNMRSFDWGTSYAAPLVAAIASECWSRLLQAGHTVDPAMVRALVIHSAAHSAKSDELRDLRYFGFGTPGNLDEIFSCDEGTFTTWHRVSIPNGEYVEHEFPMPECLLQGDKFCGEITITLCYAPPLSPENGAEYCRANVNVGMGVVKPRNTKKVDKATGEEITVTADGFRSEVPADPNFPQQGFEAELIEHGFKWSPVKVYRRKFPRGVEGRRWQLRFEVLYRDGEPIPVQPQQAFALVTVRGLGAGQPVYRDGIRAATRLGHVAHSALAATSRVQVG